MKTLNVLLFFVGLILLTIVVVDLYWWIELTSDTSKSFEQVKQEYFSKFPNFIGRGNGVTIFNLALLLSSAYLFIKSRAVEWLKTLSTIALVLCTVLGAWKIFTLM